MADWLAFGLEEAFAEANELGVTRKCAQRRRPHPQRSARVRLGSGRSRMRLRAEKADFVVMMTGLGDRRAIRERIDAKQPAPKDRREAGECAERAASADPEQHRPTEADKSGGGTARVPLREVGRALRQAHRRGDRRAQSQARAGASGSGCRRCAAPAPARTSPSSTTSSLQRREGRHRLRRYLGRLHRRRRRFRQCGPGRDGPDAPPALRRWRALHPRGRAQARALRRPRDQAPALARDFPSLCRFRKSRKSRIPGWFRAGARARSAAR